MDDLFYRIPTAAELLEDDSPYTVQDFIDARDTVDVWDENWDVLHLYRTYDTQWRVGMGGPTGLDMMVFLHELDRKNVPDDIYDDMVWKLSIIETAALKQMHKKR